MIQNRSVARRLCVPLACVALAMWAGPAAAGIGHVVHISVDGLRGDLLRDLVNTPGTQYHAFARIQAEGAVTYNARCDFDVSVTTPNHTSMLTGLPVLAPPDAPAWQQHGYLINYDIPTDNLHANGSPVGYKHGVFDRAHDRGLRTMLLVSKTKLAIFDRSWDAAHGAPDTDGPDNGPDKIDFAHANDGDSAVLIALLTLHMDGDFPAYTFVHIHDPDAAGHAYGWGSADWNLAVKHADSLLGQLLAGLDLRPALKETTALVITADHGGGTPLYTHGDPAQATNYTIPLLLWGPGLPAGADAYSLFSNRFDPGTDRPPNNAPRPPLRNGDTGNLAMALLGLPPVTDSYFRPEWRKPVDLARDAGPSVTVSWPRYLTGYRLETSDTLAPGAWTTVPAGRIQETAARFQITEPPAARRFFRLRAPD